MKHLILGLVAVQAAHAQFFNHFFNQQHQQHQQKPRVAEDYQREYAENDKCNEYLCPDTLVCVSGPAECPCPFPDSQLKCVLPGDANYVCISKPETAKEVRDCAWVMKAYEGLI